MSYAITHFSIGVIGTIILLFLTKTYGYNYSPFALFLGGYISMAPDVLRFIPLFQTSSGTLIHNHFIVNVFFGHHFMDTVIDPTDSQSISAISAVLMAGALCVYAYFYVQQQGTD